MPFALDDLKVSGFTRQDARRIQVDDGAQSKRRRVSQIVADVVYTVTFDIFDMDQYAEAWDFFHTHKTSRAFSWTAPDAAAPAKFRFRSFSPRVQGGAQQGISATISRFQGVP